MTKLPDAEKVCEELVRQLKPDVVLCDLHLPGYSGLEVTERIVRADLGVRVIIVSVLEDGPLPKRLLEAGASGYLGKAGDAAELIRAVREVSRGKRYLGSNVAQNLALHTVGGDASPFDIDLWFDASAAEHLYAFEWLPGSLAWYVDGVEMHRVTTPTARIPTTTGRVMASVWAANKATANWVGEADFTTAQAFYRCMSHVPAGQTAPQCSDTFKPPART